MYLTVRTDNPMITFIKEKLLEDGNITSRQLIDSMPDELKANIQERSVTQYISFVKTQLLNKHVVYTEKEPIK